MGVSGVRANRGSNQSIPDSTATAVSFTSEVFDYGGWWSSGTNVTVPAGAIPAGFTTIIVECVARCYFASNATGYRRINVLVNGASQVQKTVGANATAGTDDETTDFFAVAAGDVITMQVTQTSGGALNVTAILTIMRYAPAS